MSSIELIKCPACGKEVSSQAINCPNCGQPIAGAEDAEILAKEAKQISEYRKIEEYGKKTQKNKKSGKGCAVGCLVIIVLFVFGLVIGVTQGKTSKAARYMNITQEEGEKIDNILSQCGFTNVESMQHDELLDNAHFEGEKGYRVSADGLNNIILYLYADNVVYSVKYADKNLFLKGNLVATINDYVMSIKEISGWQVLCENKVKSILKSPSTAKFPNYKEWGFNKKDGIVTVQGYVDSQNGFGAEMRSKFQFIIDSNTNTIKSFIFDGQELIK